MFVWQVQIDDDTSELLQDFLSVGPNVGNLEKLRHVIYEMKADDVLKQLFYTIVSECKINLLTKHMKNIDLSVMEMIAGFQYSNKNPYAGDLKLMKDKCRNNESVCPAIRFLKSWCDDALRKEWL